MQTRTAITTLLTSTLLGATRVGASTLHVPDDQPTIQAAIDVSVSGDTILVSDGTYTGPGNRDISYGGRSITVRSENGAEATVIDCEKAGRGFEFQNGEGAEARLEGFTITHAEDYFGGAIRIYASEPTISKCVIVENTARGDGGGIECVFSNPTIIECVISNNFAGSYGGGIRSSTSNFTLTNCTISDNSATHGGGGFRCDNNSKPTITHCTIANNSTPADGGALYCYTSYPAMTNCILWGNSPNEIHVNSGVPTITYSDIQGGWAGAGNIEGLPFFADPANGDFHLTPKSPCIDSGTDTDVLTDLDGDIRPQGAGFDMGSDEHVEGGGPTTIRVPDDQPTIQAAIDVSIDGDIVLVADGTYSGPGNRDINYGGRAITVRSANGPEATVIDCEDLGRGFEFLQREGPESTLEGFTITNAYDYFGGAIRIYSASPTIKQCILTGNRAGGDGGGIECVFSSPTIIDCIISHNSAGSYGGGIRSSTSDFTLTNCILYENTATQGGGGFRFDNNSKPTITHCTIANNSTPGNGGALYCYTSDPRMTDCIMWGNTPNEFFVDSGVPGVSFSDVQGGWAGVGNIDQAPLFADAATGDFHLTSGSPCIDIGTDAGVHTDLDGDMRPQGQGFDMGADEHLGAGEGDLEVFLEDYPKCVELSTSLKFTAGVRNAGESDASFDGALLHIAGPAEAKRSLYSGAPITLEPGKSASTIVTLPVPARAPTGPYWLTTTIYLGGHKISDASFEVEVSESCD